MKLSPAEKQAPSGKKKRKEGPIVPSAPVASAVRIARRARL
jgi:hypothetical protein